MAILVSGGAGYIGSVMVEVLLRRGFQVVVADNLTRGHAEAVPSEAVLVVGDVSDVPFVDGIFRDHRIEAVFHSDRRRRCRVSIQVPGA